ncbi:site-specific integrase [Winogradskyella vincentii]|uniref:Site-specific integrase n=1 Tax=Winogradskyella vincentii TaxID=2877122 RepID=A0ABS7Y0Q5_9FLAO|nr:site-specific integrase [Winogradskyella vincentii]MCA0152915.1 site-specific integrase [Winogradskyella vincentii]
MANVKTTLDIRRPKADGTYNIIYRITHYKKVYTINSGVAILEHYWDCEHSVITKQHPNAKILNLKLLKNYYKIEKVILTLDDDFTIEKLRNIIKGNASNTSKSFKSFAQELIDQMLATNKTGNAIVYRTAMNRFLDFCDKDIMFTDIDYKLLDKFRHHLQLRGLKQNSISNYFRTIRAIYNKAIKHKIVDRSHYPFYDISIKSQRTANRSISRRDIKNLINLPFEPKTQSYKALNYFMLSFYLRGMSFTDMAYLRRSNIIKNRLHYTRRKTHKQYDVKLFSQAKSIINHLHQADQNYLLPVLPNDIIEDSLDAKRIIKQWIKTTNKYLNRLSLELHSEVTLTTYSSRYSFANIAKQLGYSNELIAEALGHSYGNRTTSIYLDAFDTNKIDAMHQHIIKVCISKKS